MPRGFKHGGKYTPEYAVWVGLRMRCRSPQGHDAKYYQGIGYPESWDDFTVFLKDVCNRPTKDHQIDRIDNTKGYSADNCRWVLRETQMQNTRISKRWIVDGVEYPSLRKAADFYGVTISRIKAWCDGRNDGGYSYPPKPNCWSEKKYV
jgi:hypothetical protein